VTFAKEEGMAKKLAVKETGGVTKRAATVGKEALRTTYALKVEGRRSDRFVATAARRALERVEW
jgi:hypothetical protein